jgi:hypothetical protein
MLVAIWHVLTTDEVYHGPGVDCVAKRDPEGQSVRLVGPPQEARTRRHVPTGNLNGTQYGRYLRGNVSSEPRTFPPSLSGLSAGGHCRLSVKLRGRRNPRAEKTFCSIRRAMSARGKLLGLCCLRVVFRRSSVGKTGRGVVVRANENNLVDVEPVEFSHGQISAPRASLRGPLRIGAPAGDCTRLKREPQRLLPRHRSRAAGLSMAASRSDTKGEERA